MTPMEELYQYLRDSGFSPLHARVLTKTWFSAPQQGRAITCTLGAGGVSKLSSWTAPEHEADLPAVTAEYDALLKRLMP